MELKQKIIIAKETARQALREYERLRSCCTHQKIVNIGGAANCDICDKILGNYCPDSPHKVCDYEHYDEEMGGRYNDFDDCIYCHEPNERK